MTWTHERARLSALKRFHPEDDPRVQDAARDLRAARLAAHIEQVVAKAPPLTPEQVQRLASMLAPAARVSP